MHPIISGESNKGSAEEKHVSLLYRSILENWNRRNARDMADLFAQDGNLVGFDGSQLNGISEIESHLRSIFTDHPPASYVGIIREVRFLTPEVAVLRAVAGMVQPGKSDINPALNAIQTLIAEKKKGSWSIAVYQNTPAAFHGQPELREQLTEELRHVLRDSSSVRNTSGKQVSITELINEDEIKKLSAPSNLRLGEEIFGKGEVELIQLTPIHASARVGGGQQRHVEFWAMPDGLDWKCTCTAKQKHIFCKHCVALGIALSQKSGKNSRKI